MLCQQEHASYRIYKPTSTISLGSKTLLKSSEDNFFCDCAHRQHVQATLLPSLPTFWPLMQRDLCFKQPAAHLWHFPRNAHQENLRTWWHGDVLSLQTQAARFRRCGFLGTQTSQCGSHGWRIVASVLQDLGIPMEKAWRDPGLTGKQNIGTTFKHKPRCMCYCWSIPRCQWPLQLHIESHRVCMFLTALRCPKSFVCFCPAFWGRWTCWGHAMHSTNLQLGGEGYSSQRSTRHRDPTHFSGANCFRLDAWSIKQKMSMDNLDNWNRSLGKLQNLVGPTAWNSLWKTFQRLNGSLSCFEASQPSTASRNQMGRKDFMLCGQNHQPCTTPFSPRAP